MKVKYANEKVESQCKNIKDANKLFGGNKKYVLGLFSRINLLENAVSLKDIVFVPSFRFHKLEGDRNGYFSIDVTNKRDKWRIICCPLDENENILIPCDIDKCAGVVQIVEIKEVSPHYE